MCYACTGLENSSPKRGISLPAAQATRRSRRPPGSRARPSATIASGCRFARSGGHPAGPTASAAGIWARLRGSGTASVVLPDRHVPGGWALVGPGADRAAPDLPRHRTPGLAAGAPRGGVRGLPARPDPLRRCAGSSTASTRGSRPAGSRRTSIRCFFSNLSADIRRLFCETCDGIGIRWTRSSHRNISISHRHSVAKMDTFIGPKY